MVVLLDGGDARSDIDHDARTLVAQDRRKQALRVGAGKREFVGMTDACRPDLHQHFTGLRPFQLHMRDRQRLARLERHRRPHLHVATSLLARVGRSLDFHVHSGHFARRPRLRQGFVNDDDCKALVPSGAFALNHSLPRPRWLIDAVILASVSIGALYATARVLARAARSCARRRGGVRALDPARGDVDPHGRGGRPLCALWRLRPLSRSRCLTIADYSARAFAAGAWLVLDPKALAACLSAFGVATADS